MQMPTQDTRRPDTPRPQAASCQPGAEEHSSARPQRRHGRFVRFMRGYLMLVGSLTTIYVLIKLLVLLFVEIGKWLPSQPLL